MSGGVSGAGSSARIVNVEPPAEQNEVAAPPLPDAPSAAGGTTPRSLDMHALDLGSVLSARLEAQASFPLPALAPLGQKRKDDLAKPHDQIDVVALRMRAGDLATRYADAAASEHDP